MAKKEKVMAWEQFLSLCMETKNKDQLDELLELFLTPEEKDHVALRLLIVRELLNGEKTQREIAKEFKISIAKITRGSNNLKKIPAKIKNFLTKQILS